MPSFDADATMIVSPKNSNKSTLVMPGALSQLADQAADQAGLPDLDMNTMIIDEPVVPPVIFPMVTSSKDKQPVPVSNVSHHA